MERDFLPLPFTSWGHDHFSFPFILLLRCHWSTVAACVVLYYSGHRLPRWEEFVIHVRKSISARFWTRISDLIGVCVLGQSEVKENHFGCQRWWLPSLFPSLPPLPVMWWWLCMWNGVYLVYTLDIMFYNRIFSENNQGNHHHQHREVVATAFCRHQPPCWWRFAFVYDWMLRHDLD